MYNLDKFPLGIYEKALPKNFSWIEKMDIAEELGFDFIEISIDETDERLKRLEWSLEERKNFRNEILKRKIRIPSMCFSAHRRFPLGSENLLIRNKALALMKKAIEFAVDLGIRNIQLAGYDVYYEESNDRTKKLYIEGMKKSLEWATKANVTLSIEIMDHPFINSITKYLKLEKKLNSPFLMVYPDIGNLSAWGNDIKKEILSGRNRISAIHLKDTLAVTENFSGKFKEVSFGEGCVNFIEFFKLLNEINYTGPLLIEMWTEKNENPIEEIKKAKKWLEKKMEMGGYSC
ncbi:MAG: L-ribulose-5-phosphate 3-epimerase [Fusobacteriaceae bacterium]